MRNILRRILKYVAYLAAACVVLLAIAVGLFRLFLPRLPEYQDEIKAWASDAIGLQVEFTGMDALWGLRGPELKFYDAELIRPDTGIRAIAAGEVGVGVSLIRFFRDNTLVVDSVTVRDSAIEVRELDDGSWRIQGVPPDELLPSASSSGSIRIAGEDVDVYFLRAGDQRPTTFKVPELVVQRDNNRIAIDLDVRLPDEIGKTLTVAATQVRTGDAGAEPWNISVDGDALSLAGLSHLYRDPRRRVTDGSGDIQASVAVLDGKIESLSATFEVAGAALNNAAAFDAAARIAFNHNADGWLVAVDELRARTPHGEWPLSSLRIETLIDGAGEVSQYDVRASYLHLADAALIAPWLSSELQEVLDTWQPDGVIRNLVATVIATDAEPRNFAVTAELEGAGIAANDNIPGIRGFSGSLRADQDGGLLAVDSRNLMVDLDKWLNEPVEVDELNGSLIWRRSAARTTILSDSIVARNAVLDSQSSIQITLEADASPTVDFASSWSVTDIAVAKRYIPAKIMTPKLFQWFQDAFRAGSIPSGTTRLTGRLADFPFDDDTGNLTIEAHGTNVDFQYLPTFPPTIISELDIVLENTHLHTQRNRSTSHGIRTENAQVHIRDLRKPVLTIDASSTGSLQAMQNFAVDSPIAGVFGGHLERFSVDGDATLELDLNVPILEWRDFEFTADIASVDGRVEIQGLDAPFSNVTGKVSVQKDSVSSEALQATFLGRPVGIELLNASSNMPAYQVIANARGTATAGSLINELGVPLEGRLAGETEYRAQVLFPRRSEDDPAALSVRVESDLVGLQLDLPAPFQKDASESRRLQGGVSFLPGGERIETRGRVQDELNWKLDFAQFDGKWDFDRGAVVLGTGQADEPDVRGLHVQGRTSVLNIEEWLNLSRGEGSRRGAGERIRSVDIVVDELYFLGQKLQNHRIQVDRSARDWLVQMQGPDIEGSIFVPYQFAPPQKLVLDMERLIFPGDEDAASVGSEPDRRPGLDPRTLPEISLRTNELGLGERRFGAVEAEFVHTSQGLVGQGIRASDATFTIQADASWLAQPTDPLGSVTSLQAALSSTDVAATLDQLGYEPGIASEEMSIALDLSWSGGPRKDFLTTIDGEVTVQLGTGQLNEVEPGAGRVFGLMSIVALPRRLSLDFRDVFQKGFGFDSIGGTFRIDDGVAYTCDLSLAGPAADIGIIGRADLVGGSYAQTAVVSANVGNTLPVVGALAAGPQVAAAMFLLSQIFKKPLKDIGQIYYDISGPWDGPVVESGDAESFAASGRLAGCLADGE